MSELQDLIDIATATPGNAALLHAVLRAARDAAEPEIASAWLARTDPAPYDARARAAAAAFLLDHDAPEVVLVWIDSESRNVILRLRALIALDRAGEAAEIYAAAIAADPSLADPDIDAALAVRHARASGGRGEANVVDLRGRPLVNNGATLNARERKTFADVGGLDEIKKDIERKIVLPFKNPALYQRFKRKSGGGVLLYGPPGCGKTLLARATAGEVDADFIAIEIAEILDMYVGQSEKRLASAFATARAKTPCVLFFDEIEAVAARRRFGEAAHGASLVSTFLNELDGAQASNEGLLVLAATNTPWAIDAAFRRPGRFDRVLFVPPPDKAARLSILQLSLADIPTENVQLDAVAQATSGYSGADLVGIIEAACDLAIEETLDSGAIAPVRQKHLLTAARARKATTLEWLSQAGNYAKYANEGGLYDDVLAFLDKHGK